MLTSSERRQLLVAHGKALAQRSRQEIDLGGDEIRLLLDGGHGVRIFWLAAEVARIEPGEHIELRGRIKLIEGHWRG